MGKIQIKKNVIVRKEFFGAIAFLRNGKRFSLTKKAFDILLDYIGKEYTSEKPENDRKILKRLIEMNIITVNGCDAGGVLIKDIPLIENSLVFPRFISLELTNKCNMKCVHCYSSSKSTNSNFISFEKVKEIIDEASYYGTEFIALGGGEPLLHPDIFDIISYACNKNVEIELVTNGMLLSTENIMKLNKSGLRYIQVSLDGNSEDTYFKMRNVGCFNQIIENIKKAKPYFNISLATVICKHTYDNIFNIIELANKLNVDSYRILKLMETGRAGDQEGSPLAISNKDMRTFVTELPNYIYKHNITIPVRIDESVFGNFKQRKIPWLEYGYYGCSAGRSTVAIDSEGNVFPCSFLNYKELICGNVNEISLYEIWTKSNVLNKYRNMNHIDGKCKQCDHLEKCLGGCRAAAYAAERGNIYAEDITCITK